MTNYGQMDTILVALAVTLLTLGCLVIAFNMRLRAADHDTQAGLAYILAANCAMLLGAVCLVMHQIFIDTLTALIIALSFHATFMLGAAGILRGMGHRPPIRVLGMLSAGFTLCQGGVAVLAPGVEWFILVSLLGNGLLCLGFMVHLGRAVRVFSPGLELLIALPFAILAGVYGARLVGFAIDVSHPVMAFGVLMTSFVLTFSLMAWCFSLQTFGNVRLAQKLLVERARAEDASQMKSRFLANMSHEIRTPLNGILGMTEVLREDELRHEQRQIVSVIHDSGQTLLRLLNDILDLSKVEAGKLTLENAPFVPQDVIAGCIALHRHGAEEKGLRLIWTCGPGLDRTCIGDRYRLAQVVTNLLNNAVKFTREGSITLRAELGAVDAADDRAMLSIEVTDTGIGMTRVEAARIFQDFSQAGDDIARRFGGTGLGLAISGRLVDLMGGTIGVESALDKGSSFRVRVPVAGLAGRHEDTTQAAQAQQAPAQGAPAAELRAQLEGLRILLAEDNRTNQMVIKGMLRHAGVDLQVVDDGQAAVALDAAIARGEIADFDVFLFDIQMPVMDGPEAFARIQAQRRATGRPLARAAVLSANAMAGQMEAYLAQGFLECLTKPVQKARLIATIRQVAETSRAALSQKPPVRPAAPQAAAEARGSARS
ncbi:MAG: ATP-binding protein [Roseinatronobacter sp.]